MCSTIVAATTTDYPRRHGEISIKNAYYLFHPIIHITCHPNESYESSFIIHLSLSSSVIGYRFGWTFCCIGNGGKRTEKCCEMAGRQVWRSSYRSARNGGKILSRVQAFRRTRTSTSAGRMPPQPWWRRRRQ